MPVCPDYKYIFSYKLYDKEAVNAVKNERVYSHKAAQKKEKRTAQKQQYTA